MMYIELHYTHCQINAVLSEHTEQQLQFSFPADLRQLDPEHPWRRIGVEWAPQVFPLIYTPKLVSTGTS